MIALGCVVAVVFGLPLLGLWLCEHAPTIGTSIAPGGEDR